MHEAWYSVPKSEPIGNSQGLNSSLSVVTMLLFSAFCCINEIRYAVVIYYCIVASLMLNSIIASLPSLFIAIYQKNRRRLILAV